MTPSFTPLLRLTLLAALAGVWSCSSRMIQPGTGNTAGTTGTASGEAGTGGALATGTGGMGGAAGATGGLGGAAGATGGLGGAAGATGSAGTRGGTSTPHRAAEVICAGPATDAAATPTDAGQDGGAASQSCTQDSDCVGCSGGWPGRCEGPGSTCVCDQCARDEDCGASGVCACDGQTFGFSHTKRGNICVRSNCRIDADCGPGGLCSPTVDISAGTFYGVAGYYCHTTNDQCTKDADCSLGDCRYAPQVGYWVCMSGGAAG